jgi:hypothetical protein
MNCRFGRSDLRGAPPSTKNTWIPLSDVVQLPPIGGDEDDEYDSDSVFGAPLPSGAK